jgi:hypothetical protein
LKRFFRKYQPTINLRKKSILAAFLIGFLLLLIPPALGVVLRLHYFMPAMIIAVYQKPLSTSIWIGIFCGVVSGLFAKVDWMGIYALANVAAIACITYYRRYFFSDSFSTLPLLTTLGSCIATFVIAISIVLLDKAIVLSMKLLIYDAILMAFADGLYALMIFTLPAFVAQHFTVRRIATED